MNPVYGVAFRFLAPKLPLVENDFLNVDKRVATLVF